MAQELIQKAALLAGANMTMQDHLRILQSGGKLSGMPMPPTNYAAVVKLVSTYAAKLFAQWTERNLHYKQIMEIRRILKIPQVEAEADNFPCLLGFQLVWAILVNSRQFYNKKMHPDDLTKGRPDYPISTLAHVNVHLMTMTPISTNHNFPPRWAAAAAVHDAARNAMMQGGQ